MTNEQYEEQKQRYEELAARYFANGPMTGDELIEFLQLWDIYGTVEE